MKYGNRSLWKRISSSPFALVVVVPVFLFVLKATWNIHRKVTASSDRLASTVSALEELEKRNTDLSQKVEYLSTDKGIESEIRTKFRATDDGEYVAVIVEDKKAVSTSTTSIAKNKSLWSRLFR